MIVADQLVQELLETLRAIRARLEKPADGEDRLLTVEELCARWSISRRQFYNSGLSDKLIYCQVSEDGRPRYPLSVIVAHERAALRNPDGSPVHPPEPQKREARRKRGTQTEMFSTKAAA